MNPSCAQRYVRALATCPAAYAISARDPHRQRNEIRVGETAEQPASPRCDHFRVVGTDRDARRSADRATNQAMNPHRIHPDETSHLSGGRVREPTPGWTSQNPRHSPPGPLRTSRVPPDIDHTERS